MQVQADPGTSLIGELIRNIPLHLVPVATMTVIFLILRSPAGLLIVRKLFNGQEANGSSKSGTAGAASTEYWREQLRDITESVIARRDREFVARHESLIEKLEDLKDEMRTMVSLQREDVTATHDSATRIIDALRSPSRRGADWKGGG